MNILDLEKVIIILKKYDLLGNIDNFNKWFFRLNEKRINNLLSIYNMNLNKVLKHKGILVNLDFLNSPYYIEDIKIMEESKNDDILGCLIDVALEKDSYINEYHTEDMNMILNAKDSYTAYYLSLVACNYLSIYNDYHKEDMKKISNSNNYDAKYLSIIATDYKSLISGKHKEDMDNLNIGKLPSKEDVSNDKKISNIYEKALKYVDGNTDKKIPKYILRS